VTGAEGEIVTRLENRPNTALVVLDMQSGVVEGADVVVANVAALVDRARREAAASTELVYDGPGSGRVVK
jgi:hypothetical protein